MKKYIIILILITSFAYSDIRIRPQIIQGKMTNGNQYLEFIPLRLAYNPVEEWEFGLGYSLGFEKSRGATFTQPYNHRGWKTIVKAQFKPLKFIESFVPKNTIYDFAISYTKQIGNYYDGSFLDVGRLDYNDYEEVSLGFDFNI